MSRSHVGSAGLKGWLYLPGGFPMVIFYISIFQGSDPTPLDMLGKKRDEENSFIFTFLPTSLLWRFILFRMFSDFSDRVDSDASTNCRLNSIPYLTLSLHPPHFQPSTVCSPSRALTSHVHVVKFPAVHACVTECTTPALKIEYINAVSLVPKKKKKTN